MDKLKEKQLKDVSLEEFILYAKEQFGITIIPTPNDKPTTMEQLFGTFKLSKSNSVSYEDGHICVLGHIPATLYHPKDAKRYVETMCDECPYAFHCSGNRANYCNDIKEDIIRMAKFYWETNNNY